MRIVVTGATGNVGTSVVAALRGDPAVGDIVGLARRRPERPHDGVEHVAADIRSADLTRLLAGADAVIHLAWVIQPAHERRVLRDVNVGGTARLLQAMADAEVPALVYASSVGAYGPGPVEEAVDESWPTDGVPTSSYSADKAAVERLLDRFEREHPASRVVRLRKALIFKREAASEVGGYFLGPFLPRSLLRRSTIPAVPSHPRLRFQAVHTDDVADAYRRAVLGDARGPYNVAAPPVLDGDAIARLLDARPVRLPAWALRAGAAATFHARLQPTEPGWVDLALAAPVMDTSRISDELGWRPTIGAEDALLELIEGLRAGAGADTPPLEPGRRTAPIPENEPGTTR